MHIFPCLQIGKWLIKALVFVALFLLLPSLAFAGQPASENYQMGNVNFGQLMFLTTNDYSPPTILGSGPEIVELTPTSVKIKWLTDKNTSSSILYGNESKNYFLESSKAFDSTTSHVIEIANLNPKTKYFFIAKSKDAGGNVAESEEKSFITPLPIPELTNIKVQDIKENSAIVVFNTNYYTTAVIEYIDTDTLGKGNIGETGFSRDHSVLLQNLQDNREYACFIIARDDEGHQSQSASFSFSTLKDVTTPIIDNVKFDLNVISGKNKVRATIGWKTNEDSTSRIKYKESNAESYIESSEIPDLVKNHFVTLPDLKPQTTYKMIAVSKDKTANLGQSEEFVILTPKQKRTFLQIILENIQSIFEPFSKLFNG